MNTEGSPSADRLSVAELIAAARAAGDHDGTERWPYIWELRWRGGGAAAAAAEALTRCDAESERVLGTDILAQLGYADPSTEPAISLRRRAVARLAEMSASDPAVAVIRSVVSGLGHHRDPSTLGAVVMHATHPDSEVRWAVATALPGLARAGGEHPAPAPAELQLLLATLVALCGDEVDDIRDWALFGLGVQLDVDTPEIRDLLASHLHDPYQEARDEAVLGLARRHDQRAFPVVLAALNPADVTGDIVEAAAHLGDERLLPGLRALCDDAWATINTPLADALRACGPAERARWAGYTATLAAELEERLRAAIGDRLFVVSSAPHEYRPWLQAEWTGLRGGPVTLDYDLTRLVETRLGGDLANAGELFDLDIAGAERTAARERSQ